MRWSEPQIGEVRIIRKFLWWPILLNGQTRWLERVSVRQVFAKGSDGVECWRWIEFVDLQADTDADTAEDQPLGDAEGNSDRLDPADEDAGDAEAFEFVRVVKTARALRDPSAVDMLVGMGDKAIPVLLRTAQSDLNAVHPVLARIGADVSVPAIVESLRSPVASVRQMAAVLLSYPYLKPQATAAVPALFDALRDEDSGVRCAAMRALSAVAEPAQARRMLCDALTDEDARTRKSAVDLIGELGESATEAVPALLESLQDQNAEVREAVAAALQRIRGPVRDA